MKWFIMAILTIESASGSVMPLDISPFLGDSWYGLYFNGEKVGYMVKQVSEGSNQWVEVVEDAHFMVTMSGAKQSMRMYSKRTYEKQGDLLRIEMEMNDPAQKSIFVAEVIGGELRMKSILGGAVREEVFPKPHESIQDALRYGLWVRQSPEVGSIINFSAFEPMYQKEVSGISRISGITQRIFNGVPTKVYEIKSVIDIMDLESTTYVTDCGTTVEDIISGTFTMRLEPEEAAKDVDYSVDTMVSNAVMLSGPIPNPRTRTSLRLQLRGPLRETHLFNDQRQTMVKKEDYVEFTSVKADLSLLPDTDTAHALDDVLVFLKPSAYIQSDNPRIIEKAQSIVGDEKSPLKKAQKLCNWVNANMRNVFSARLSNALEVLDNLEGDCTEHSVLFVGLARAAGLPAKESAGLIYVEDTAPGFYFHQWASVWVGEWLDVDPAFNQLPVDATHIKLAEGDLFRQAKILPLIGNLKIDVLPDH